MKNLIYFTIIGLLIETTICSYNSRNSLVRTKFDPTEFEDEVEMIHGINSDSEGDEKLKKNKPIINKKLKNRNSNQKEMKLNESRNEETTINMKSKINKKKDLKGINEIKGNNLENQESKEESKGNSKSEIILLNSFMIMMLFAMIITL